MSEGDFVPGSGLVGTEAVEQTEEFISAVDLFENSVHRRVAGLISDYLDANKAHLAFLGGFDQALEDGDRDYLGSLESSGAEFAASRMLLGEVTAGRENLGELREEYPRLAEIETRVDDALKIQDGDLSLDEGRSRISEVERITAEVAEDLVANYESMLSHLFSRIDYRNLFRVYGGVDNALSGDRVRLQIDFAYSVAEIDRDGGEPEWLLFNRLYRLLGLIDHMTSEEWQRAGVVVEHSREVEEHDLSEVSRRAEEAIEEINKANELRQRLRGGTLAVRDRVPYFIFTLARLEKDESEGGDLAKLMKFNPRLAEAMLAEMEDLRARLGEEENVYWGEVLNIRALYELLEKVGSEEDSSWYVRTQETVDEALKEFEVVFEREAWGRRKTEELMWDNKFARFAERFLEECEVQLPSDMRILRSQLMGIYCLFTGGGLDKMYESYLDSLDGESPSEDEANRIKVELAYGFLEGLSRKHKDFFLEADPMLASVGIEAEYDDDLDHLQDMIEHDLKFAAELDDLDESKSPLASFLKSKFQVQVEVAKKAKQVLSKLDYPVDLINSATVPHVISEFGPVMMENTFEGWPSYRELITSPVVDYRLMIRDLLVVWTRSGGPRDVNLHFSVGGVELSPEEPEPSEVRAILAGTGWLQEEEPLSDVEREMAEDGELLRSEVYFKAFRGDGRVRYLPYHSIRENGSEFVAYNSDLIPKGFEIRSLSKYFGKPEQFPKQVRTAAFVCLSAQGIRAKQVLGRVDGEVQERTEQLVDNWDKMIDEWKAVLEKHGIDYVPLDERFEELERVDDKLRRKEGEPMKYARFLQAMEVAARENPEFRSEVRAVVTRYNKEARRIMGMRGLDGKREVEVERLRRDRLG